MTQAIHPLLQKKIREIKQRYPLADHPLIVGISARHYNLEQMHLIAERFYHVIRNFPRFLAAMISHWDDTEARMPLVENLFEEHGRMDKRRIHVNTYVDFLDQMGIDIARIKAAKATPATISYCSAVLYLCSNGHPNRGLGALGYIEDIVHQVSAIIGTAVKKEQKNIKEVSHFSDHEILDDQHSLEIYSMLELNNQVSVDEALLGLTLGAYLHHQLYESILSEIMYESDGMRALVQTPDASDGAYPLKTGSEGRIRLDILNSLYNDTSIRFISKHAPTSFKSFLEFGCGTGRLSHELSKRFPDWHMMAIDNSYLQIELAQETWPRSANLQFQVGDLEYLKKTKMRFDMIYLRWVLIYQKQIDIFIEAFAHLLNEGGVLIIEDNEPGQSGCFSPSHQSNVLIWENFWTQAMSFIGQSPGFCSRLHQAAQNSNLTLSDFSINQQLLVQQGEKELFHLGILESEEAILQAGLPRSIFEEILKNASTISKSPLPIGFVRNFQICFKK